MEYFRIKLLVLIGISYMPLVFAQELSGSAETHSANTRLLYSKNCSVCHGDSGDANTRAAGSMSPRPRNFTDPTAAKELTRERMINSVTYGRPGTAMVAHGKKLSAQQIEALVDYIRANYMHIPLAGGNGLLAKYAAGRSIFEKHCAVCHGDRGNGAMWAQSGLNPAPRDFTTAVARTELTRERMVHSVTNGRAGTAMQPFAKRLTAQEIDQVVDYVRADFMALDGSEPASAPPTQAVVPAPGPHQGVHEQASVVPEAVPAQHATMTSSDMSEPMPKGLKGEIAKGKAFYMSNCITCHGAKGDGNGPRSHFITPRPRNFTSDMSRSFYNRPMLFDAISIGKRGTVMPAWGKVLNDQEIANVAEFVFRSYIQANLEPATTDDGDKKKVN